MISIHSTYFSMENYKADANLMIGDMMVTMTMMVVMIMRRRSMTIRTHCFLAISQGGRVDFESPDASGMEEEGMRLANLKIHVSIV